MLFEGESCLIVIIHSPVGKIAEKAVCRSVFLTIWQQKYAPTDCFFGDFAHWDPNIKIMYWRVSSFYDNSRRVP